MSIDISSLSRHVKAAELPLDKLAASSQVPEQEKVAEVSRQFEALLLRQILSESQKTVIQSKYNASSFSGGVYQDMMVEQLADQISKSGDFGLARSLQKELGHELIHCSRDLQKTESQEKEQTESLPGSSGTHAESHEKSKKL